MTREQVLELPTVRVKLIPGHLGKGVDIGPLCKESVARFLVPLLREEDRECLLAVLISTRRRVLAVHTVSIGTLQNTPAHPMQVFKAAILANAYAVIVAHNHPSGEAEPSSDDWQLTRRLTMCAEILGITLFDHIIVGCEQAFSFKEADPDIFQLPQSWREPRYGAEQSGCFRL